MVHPRYRPSMSDRCGWVPVDDPLYLAYHDEEWGLPAHDEQHLFEMLTLEGAQAGLSWRTILYKRDGYRKAFAGFDAVKVARFTPARVGRLLTDPSIVRNRLKVESTVANARAIVGLDSSLEELLWSFVDGEPVANRWRRLSEVPAETPASRAMSRDLKRRGFRFVGPTVCYALMQATGLVNDHVADCFRWAEVQEVP
jgi:DNA-3-methyladenine glycosylase I